MRFPGLAIWNQAVRFHLTYWKNLLPIFPLMCLPVVGDALYSLLIRQKVQERTLYPGQAVGQVWRLIPPLLSMKAYFEGAALLWSFIPIYGVIKCVKHRLYWAMASNVLVFERLSGETGRTRCRKLSQNLSIGMRTLVTIPMLLFFGLFILWVVGGAFLETIHSFGFWVLILVALLITVPLSGAVNSFLYVAVQEDKMVSHGYEQPMVR